jgi:virginiamycin B lyase
MRGLLRFGRGAVAGDGRGSRSAATGRCCSCRSGTARLLMPVPAAEEEAMRYSAALLVVPIALVSAALERTPASPPVPAPGIAALSAVAMAPSDPIATASDVEFTEWTVPWEGTRPRDPYVDGEGRVWFVGQAGNYIAYLDPATGEFRRYEIEEGTHPHNLIIDEAGMVWYAGNRNARIGRLDPATGETRTYPMPDQAARDPHTLIFDQAGDIWFTVQGGNRVGKLTLSTGEIRLFTPAAENTRPYGIIVDGNNAPWFNLFNTNRIGTIDPNTMQMREIALPRTEARTRRIEQTSDGHIWYVDYAGGHVGRIDPRTDEVREWPTPSGARAQPYAMAVDDRDRVWFVESGVHPNRFVGFDPRTEQFFSNTPIDSRTIRHMVFHAPTREIWFGTDAGTIGRARLP